MGVHAYQCKAPGCVRSHDGWESDYCRECRERREEIHQSWCEGCDERVDNDQLCECGSRQCKWCCPCGRSDWEDDQ